MSQPNVTIRPYRCYDRHDVSELWADRFGEVPQALRDDLTAMLLDDDSVQAYVAKQSTGALAGFVIGRVDDAEAISDELRGSLRPEELSDPAGLVSEIAVSRTVEGCGIATELLNALHAWLAASAADRVYAISWRRIGHDSFDLFTSAGYRERDSVDAFFADRSTCPDCGGDCSCPASILEYRPVESPPHRVEQTGPIELQATREDGARRVPDV